MRPVFAADFSRGHLVREVTGVVDFGGYELISLAKILFSSEGERDYTDCQRGAAAEVTPELHPTITAKCERNRKGLMCSALVCNHRQNTLWMRFLLGLHVCTQIWMHRFVNTNTSTSICWLVGLSIWETSLQSCWCQDSKKALWRWYSFRIRTSLQSKTISYESVWVYTLKVTQHTGLDFSPFP